MIIIYVVCFLMSVSAMNHPSEHELVISGKNHQIPVSAYKYTKVEACNQNVNCFGCALSDGCQWDGKMGGGQCTGTANGNLMDVSSLFNKAEKCEDYLNICRTVKHQQKKSFYDKHDNFKWNAYNYTFGFGQALGSNVEEVPDNYFCLQKFEGQYMGLYVNETQKTNVQALLEFNIYDKKGKFSNTYTDLSQQNTELSAITSHNGMVTQVSPSKPTLNRIIYIVPSKSNIQDLTSFEIHADNLTSYRFSMLMVKSYGIIAGVAIGLVCCFCCCCVACICKMCNNKGNHDFYSEEDNNYEKYVNV